MFLKSKSRIAEDIHVNDFVEINTIELLDINGGCVGCKIGETLMAIGTAIALPPSIPILVWDLFRIWA